VGWLRDAALGKDFRKVSGGEAMKRLALVLCILGGAAMAQESAIIGQQDWQGRSTTITLRETQAPGAVAEVGIFNVNVNQEPDDGGYPLSFDGLTVTVYFVVRLTGPDQFTVEVPEGYIAHPETVDVGEDAGAVVLIYSADGVGM
jgi:hypothetical protein